MNIVWGPQSGKGEDKIHYDSGYKRSKQHVEAIRTWNMWASPVVVEAIRTWNMWASPVVTCGGY